MKYCAKHHGGENNTPTIMKSKEDCVSAWRAAKAKADRLWWQLHRQRVNEKRRRRYKEDFMFRERIKAYAKRYAAAKRDRQRNIKQEAI
jgi:hypothetical protein